MDVFCYFLINSPIKWKLSCVDLVWGTSYHQLRIVKSIVFLSHLIMLNYFSYLVFVFVFQLLWSFCYSQLEEAETRPFRLTHAIPGASRSLDYDSQSTFEESGLANSMISVTWDWRTLCLGVGLKNILLGTVFRVSSTGRVVHWRILVCRRFSACFLPFLLLPSQHPFNLMVNWISLILNYVHTLYVRDMNL